MAKKNGKREREERERDTKGETERLPEKKTESEGKISNETDVLVENCWKCVRRKFRVIICLTRCLHIHTNLAKICL